MNPLQDPLLLKALIIILLLVAMIDLRYQTIPNIITIPTAVGALAYHAGLYGFSGLIFSLVGLGAGLLLCLPPRMLGWLGGDVSKLMGTVGAFLGAKALVGAFVFTAFLSGLYALSVILLHCNGFSDFSTKSQAALDDLFLKRKIRPGSQPLIADPLRMKLGLAVACGTGLYIVIETKGFAFFIG